MKPTTVRIPTPLRSFTAGADEVCIAGATVGEVLRGLGEQYDGLAERLLGPDGELRQFINVFVGSENVRALQGLQTPVGDGAIVSIIPAVAGGSG
ncbi:MAG: MoaD/ThiS family protein [Planctomycetota bacterium]|nr:MoaD/ThiS family protein [Planctomycetota bacterium]